MNKTAIILAKRIGSKILVLRNQKVILDTDLAELYGVPVKRLNEHSNGILNVSRPIFSSLSRVLSTNT
jgi:hypothetical protein